MPQLNLPAAGTGLPISREQVEAQISLLIELLDAIDVDPDLEPDTDEDGADPEPSLGWSVGFAPEYQVQEGRRFYTNADGGQDLEDEHDGCEPSEDPEPDVDSEYSLGWGTGDAQEGGSWRCVTDLEDSVGAVRKKRPESKTGGNVCRGSILV